MRYYRELARRLRRRYLDSLGNVVLQNPADVYSDCNQAATAINDLIEKKETEEITQNILQEIIKKYKAYAEAAEADRDRLREAMKPNCLMCDSMHENGNCTEVGGFCTAVPAAYCPLIPKLKNRAEAAEESAEKAEREIERIKKIMREKGDFMKNEKIDIEKSVQNLLEKIYERFGVDAERLVELAQADKEGRCVVLPCKIGAPVWSSCFCSIDENGEEHPTGPWDFSVAMMDEWGENWHLTQEDAEAVLKGDQDGKNNVSPSDHF